MTATPQPTGERSPEGITSISVILARILWTLLGPAVMGLVAVAIVTRGNGWLTPLDAFYAVVVALMIGGRWVEQRSGTATTVTGVPATIEHWRRYTIVLLIVAAAVWAAANLAGNHLLS